MAQVTPLDHLINAVSVAKDDPALGHDMLNLLLSIRTFRQHLPGKGNYSRLMTQAFTVIEREMLDTIAEFKKSQEPSQ